MEIRYMYDAYQPIIAGGRGIFPEDFRVKAPLGFNDAVRAAAQLQHMTRAEKKGVNPRGCLSHILSQSKQEQGCG
jgi:hypothetical protein